jgi:predicted polyphosphate/ATP-dependent NAD kinase
VKLGFIVNPIAGMGGKVGLKGTNGVVNEAIARGATPVAPKRGIEFLRALKKDMDEGQIEILTCPDVMGENEAKQAGFEVQLLPMRIGEKTTAEDTKTATKLLVKAHVDLMVFVGGDGTAKDIHDALRERNETLVLGVPAGVKMYSGVFAVNPAAATDIVVAYARKQAEVVEFEIIDADEAAIRSDSFAIRLYGYLKGPFVPLQTQGSKQISPETVDEKENQAAIAKFIIEEMKPDGTYILGPGTTVRFVAEMLGVEKTVLGVDIYRQGKVLLDVDEKKILETVEDWKNTWIVVSPIGHQGILLGRGNQQISPDIVKRVGKDHLIAAATRSKLQDIEGRILRIDTGSEEVDNMLRGYIRVVTDYGEWRVMPVK